MLRLSSSSVGVVMTRWIRRSGIAIGSFVAAFLVVGLVGGVLLPIAGINPAQSGAASGGGLAAFALAAILGGLIYRDIIRRDERPS
jgi:hypothetical protein